MKHWKVYSFENYSPQQFEYIIRHLCLQKYIYILNYNLKEMFWRSINMVFYTSSI